MRTKSVAAPALGVMNNESANDVRTKGVIDQPPKPSLHPVKIKQEPGSQANDNSSPNPVDAPSKAIQTLPTPNKQEKQRNPSNALPPTQPLAPKVVAKKPQTVAPPKQVNTATAVKVKEEPQERPYSLRPREEVYWEIPEDGTVVKTVHEDELKGGFLRFPQSARKILTCSTSRAKRLT